MMSQLTDRLRASSSQVCATPTGAGSPVTSPVAGLTVSKVLPGPIIGSKACRPPLAFAADESGPPLQARMVVDASGGDTLPLLQEVVALA